jgi:protoporphyrinogen oxidase
MEIIIGAGLAGLSAGYHLGLNYTILEQNNQVGGLCRSIEDRGYTFDFAPHIFFTGSQYVNGLIDEILNGDHIRQQRKAFIYLKSTYIEYPFEVNLNGLPQEVINECIEGAKNRESIEPKNFEEWIYSTFGSGVAKHYMVPYNEKIWKFNLDGMNIDWIAGRVPAPTVEEIVKGAEGKAKKNYGPNAFFLYPRNGGIGSIPTALAKRVRDIRLSSNVIEIKPRDSRSVDIVYMKGIERKMIEAKHVLASMPLPEIVKSIKDAPEEVIKAAEKLVHNSLVCVNVGVDRSQISDKHWLYFPEKEYIFNRISFPMNFSPETTPKGRSSILVEVTYRGKKPDLKETKEKVKEGLLKAEILRENDKLDVFDAHDFNYAYVIYDLDHKKNVSIIHDYLKINKILPIGRFGEWEYLNMDKSILSGKIVAERIRGEKN